MSQNIRVHNYNYSNSSRDYGELNHVLKPYQFRIGTLRRVWYSAPSGRFWNLLAEISLQLFEILV